VSDAGRAGGRAGRRISGSDLLDRLTNGTGVADLLAQNPDVSAQLAESQNRGALVDGYT
jgi:uncharacterized protein (DUF433 family)